MDFLNRIVLGNPLRAWIASVAVAAGAFALLLLVRRAGGQRLAAFAARTGTKWDDLVAALIAGTRAPFLVVVALYAGSLAVRLPEKARAAVDAVAAVAFLIQAALWGNTALAHIFAAAAKAREATDPASVGTIHALGFVGRLALWSVALLLILDNVGIDVTALIAGLGIGGIAVALAAQNILGDLFASLSIVLDRPFIVGDFIVVGDVLGTVEKIGIKTTRIRSLTGEQIVVSNADLLTSRIRNFKRMAERRGVFSIGVTYDTPAEKVAAIPDMVRAAVEAQPKTRFDRAHFKTFGASALEFEVVYWLTDPDHKLYMDTQQAINLVLLRRFREEGIEFAFPTQSVHVTMRGAA